MNLIEVEAKMGKDGIIQIPEAELKVMGLNEGDDICLLYIGQSDDSKGIFYWKINIQQKNIKSQS